MHEEIVRFAQVCGALITIGTFVGFVVRPFQNALKNNNDTMRLLQDAIRTLSFDLKEAKRDRDSIHKVLDAHEGRIHRTEEEIIVQKEQLKLLFHKEK